MRNIAKAPALTGKVAVVLGASAKHGSGWAIAAALAAAGAHVIVGARSLAPLRELAAEIDGIAVPCDVAVESQVRVLAEKAVARHGKIDIAVNAAGRPVLGTIAAADDVSLELATRTNYFGNVYFIKHMAAAMIEGGSIVIMSSLATTHPIMPNFAYSCAKSATDCLVRYAAIEYGARGIRVNSILPGGIHSDMTRELYTPEVVKTCEKEVPLGRLGYPSDFADAVLWLAGSAFVTGLNIPVCGGNQLTRFPYPHEFPGAEQAWEGTGPTLFERNAAKEGNL